MAVHWWRVERSSEMDQEVFDEILLALCPLLHTRSCMCYRVPCMTMDQKYLCRPVKAFFSSSWQFDWFCIWCWVISSEERKRCVGDWKIKVCGGLLFHVWASDRHLRFEADENVKIFVRLVSCTCTAFLQISDILCTCTARFQIPVILCTCTARVSDTLIVSSAGLLCTWTNIGTVQFCSNTSCRCEVACAGSSLVCQWLSFTVVLSVTCFKESHEDPTCSVSFVDQAFCCDAWWSVHVQVLVSTLDDNDWCGLFAARKDQCHSCVEEGWFALEAFCYNPWLIAPVQKVVSIMDKNGVALGDRWKGLVRAEPEGKACPGAS